MKVCYQFDKMKLLLVFAAVLSTVSAAPHNVKKFSKGDENLFKLNPDFDPPDSVNWVEKGAVTSVKDQGDCGSCYAFSAAGALEGLFYIQNKTLTDVSEQELIDCTKNYGCDGGYPSICFQYVISRPGINSDNSYPYTAEESGECLAMMNQSAGYCTSYIDIPKGDEKALLQAVATIGPVSVCIAANNDFVKYERGVFTGDCADSITHAVLVVGYGTDNETNKDYWLVKNSWGSYWGENGYIRMERNINLCSIADLASYPLFKTNS